MNSFIKTIFPLLILLAATQTRAENLWFEEFKRTASDEDLYRFLYAMPKGGDLHNHLSGAGFPEWWYELAVAQKARGLIYYTKIKINNCRPYGTNEFGFNPYLLLFVNISQHSYQRLSDCEKAEYKKLEDLTVIEKTAWLNSLRLDAPHEGRDEFFQTHWQRLNELYINHEIQAEILVRNMIAFGKEGLSYLEIDVDPVGINARGEILPPEEVYAYYENRLQQLDARESGVEVRFHYALLRFAPDAEQRLTRMYDFVDRHRDRYVAIDMVGREDNDKGYPLRFLSTLRQLRRDYPDIELSIHAGEVDEPNHHIRDTLLLGANRIGHGFNLLTDPDTLLMMRHGPYLVEINLVSNLLLEYVDDYSDHPFPELLRLEVPVALTTDDRGMWDSNITDEFFVAVKEFNLSWDELTTLHRNSLTFGFMPENTKQVLLTRLEKRLTAFENQVKNHGVKRLQKYRPVKRGFICRQYQLCSNQ